MKKLIVFYILRFSKKRRIRILNNVFYRIHDGVDHFICISIERSIMFKYGVSFDLDVIRNLFKMNREEAIKNFQSDPCIDSIFWWHHYDKNRLKYVKHLIKKQ